MTNANGLFNTQTGLASEAKIRELIAVQKETLGRMRVQQYKTATSKLPGRVGRYVEAILLRGEDNYEAQIRNLLPFIPDVHRKPILEEILTPDFSDFEQYRQQNRLDTSGSIRLSVDEKQELERVRRDLIASRKLELEERYAEELKTAMLKDTKEAEATGVESNLNIAKVKARLAAELASYLKSEKLMQILIDKERDVQKRKAAELKSHRNPLLTK